MLSATEFGDVLFRDDADDVGRASAAPVLDHHRHNGLVAGHALNDIEHDVGFARDGEFALHDVGEVDAAIGSFDAAPQSWY